MAEQPSVKEPVESAATSNSTNRSGDLSGASERTEPVLLYDAKCDLCKNLALEVRSFARKPIRLVALSDPEASRMLSEFYPNGWSHDFYLITDGTCRKGARALPKLMGMVGAKRFASLVGDYAAYKRHSEECGSEHDHTHDHQADQEDRGNATGVSRRAFTGMVGAAAMPLATRLSNLTPEEKRPFSNKPPEDLRVHVVTVRPDGQGSFETSIERDQGLIRKKSWQAKGKNKDKQSVDMETVTDAAVRNTDILELNRTVNSIIPQNVSNAEQQAIQASSADTDGTGRAVAYGLISDRSRYGLSLNLGRGPMVTPDGPTVATTMSGRIDHDVAQSVIDFVKFESTEGKDLATHLNGYVAGFQALQTFYAERDNTKMAGVYKRITGGLLEIKPEIVDAIDEQVEPMTNIIGVSSIPYWVRYVEQPAYSSNTFQTEDITGYGCNCSCCVGCCVGCGCGCTLGFCFPPYICFCNCCAGGCGAGCTCGCCYCA